ncbi:MAG: heme A synthase [Halioglobus sp.]|nr:heme A synthase [Halioglobus sp.]
MHPIEQAQRDRQVALWLVFCAAVVFGMVLLGAVTRLTGSGLSMVDWKPLMGVVPPLSEQAWQASFEQYQQYPEYQTVNRGMDLAGYKRIFMFEYLHRVLGRLIGVIFLLPLLYFAYRRMLRPGLAPRLSFLFVLGGLQGLLGWYMVQSGLVNMPRVSQYRLTSHLGLAVAIYAYMLWLVFDLVRARADVPANPAGGLRGSSLLLAGLVYLMILSGGLVAGTRAGFAYPTWPLMGDSFVPPGLYATSPWWLAAFENITTVQFNHRLFAYLLFVLINVQAWRLWRLDDAASRRAALLLALALNVQVVLGISTLLLQVPVALATAHQGGALLLLTAALYAAHVRLRQ